MGLETIRVKSWCINWLQEVGEFGECFSWGHKLVFRSQRISGLQSLGVWEFGAGRIYMFSELGS